MMALSLNRLKFGLVTFFLAIVASLSTASDLKLDEHQSICNLPPSDADWAPAINCAIDFVNNTGGGIVQLPAGGIRIYSNIYIKSNVELHGNGRRLGSALHVSVCNSTPVIQVTEGGFGEFVKIKDMSVLTDKSCSYHQPTLYINSNAYVTLENVQLYHTVNDTDNYERGRLEIVNSSNVKITDSVVWSQDIRGVGVYINNSHVAMSGVDYEGFEYGLKVKDTGVSGERIVSIEGGYFERVVWGIWLENSSNNKFVRINISVRNTVTSRTPNSRGIFFSGNSSNNVVRSSFIGVADSDIYAIYSSVSSSCNNLLEYVTYTSKVKNPSQITLYRSYRI